MSYGPRRVTQQELRAAFADGWTVASITADTQREAEAAACGERLGLGAMRLGWWNCAG